jgi:hypothetical protein
MAKSAAKSKAVLKRKAAAKTTATARAKRAAPKRASTKPAGKATAAQATAPKAKVPARKSAVQRFTVSHLKEKDFKRDGLRPYAKYRDLGIAKATGGLAQAHVIRLVPPCTDEVRKRHTHAVELQLIYVLKGWIRNEFEGHGEQLMREGTSWLQPPNIKHTVLDYSDDCEMLEIIVPANFDTTEV